MTHQHRNAIKRYRAMTLEERLAFVAGELDTTRLIVTEQRAQIADLRRLVAIQRRIIEAAGLAPAPGEASNEQQPGSLIGHLLAGAGSAVGELLARDLRGSLERTLERLHARRSGERGPHGRDAGGAEGHVMPGCALGPCDNSKARGGPGCYLCDVVAKGLVNPAPLRSSTTSRDDPTRREAELTRKQTAKKK